jgi:hypothetical protein
LFEIIAVLSWSRSAFHACDVGFNDLQTVDLFQDGGA